MRNSHVFARIAILTLLAMVFATGAGAEETESSRTIAFVDADAGEHTLEAFTGHPVLLNFWATWCTPCVKEMPSLNALQRDYGERGLKVVAVSEDFRQKKAEEFFEEQELNALTLYFDAGSRLLRSYQADGLPISILYDAEGQEVERFRGAVDWESPEVRKKIEALLP